MDPMFSQLGIAVLLGLLVGLQREHVAGGIAGMRTFPLITVLGCVAARLAEHFGESWIIAAGLLAVVAVIIVGHLFRPRPDVTIGTTTDTAIVLMYVVGALTVIGPVSVAIVVGGIVAVLLQFKPELHGIARRLGDDDLRAIMQFVLITCIILPVLPNRTFGPMNLLTLRMPEAGSLPGPLDVLNPFETWLMVVLIVGMSLAGYITYKFFGRSAGILLGGIFGGAISSTATTVSYARMAKNDVQGIKTAAVVIMIASTVMYARVLLAVTVISPAFATTVLVPALVLAFLTLLPEILVWRHLYLRSAEMPEPNNPTQLKSAIVFGLMYALVLLGLAAARHYWNGFGLYTVAFLSGLTEMDALTLSTVRMSLSDDAIATNGWRLIILAAMANTVSKTVIAGLLGGWRLFVYLSMLFLLPVLCTVLMLVF